MPNRITRTQALPVDLFADQAVFEMEIAEIWHRDWVFAAPADAVARPGDFVTVQIGFQPVVVVRTDDYQLRALANICSHRGAPLAEGCGNASRFACPYHGWTYDSFGQLVSIPYASVDEVDKAAHSLETFEVAQWEGLIFVCLSDDVEPLATRVAAIDPYVKQLGVDRLVYDAATSLETWNANWKLIYANGVDSYSHFRVHAETIEPVSPTDAAYYLAGSGRATVTGGESAERADHIVIALPPSFIAVVYPDAMIWQAIRPVSVDRTGVQTGMAGESRTGTAVSLPGWDAAFLDEDRGICETVQSNAASRWRPGPLLEIERAVGDFHDYLAWRLNNTEPTLPVIGALPGERPDPLL